MPVFEDLMRCVKICLGRVQPLLELNIGMSSTFGREKRGQLVVDSLINYAGLVDFDS